MSLQLVSIKNPQEELQRQNCSRKENKQPCDHKGLVHHYVICCFIYKIAWLFVVDIIWLLNFVSFCFVLSPLQFHLWVCVHSLVSCTEAIGQIKCFALSSPHPIFIWCTTVYTVWWTSLRFVAVAFWSSRNCGPEVPLFDFWSRCNSDTF